MLATFGYNELGERISLTRGNGRVTTWTPDVAGRLQSIAHGFANSASDVTLSFTRDVSGRIGDRTTSNDAYAWRGWAPGNKSYSANGLNQYTTADNGAMGYDDNGNTLTLPNNLGLTYNALDQLVSANNGTSLAYDPLGRLAYLSGTNGTVRFDYEGQDLISEIDGGGNVLRRYVHADGVDEPLVWYEGAGAGDRRWLHSDERGSVIATSNTSGTQTSTNRYDSYGVPASGNVGRFQYTGQTWLPELGMYYYKARMYAPGIGRFVQTDPIGVAGGVNLYRYAGNDPVNSSDPSGLIEPDIVRNQCGPSLNTLGWSDSGTVYCSYGVGSGSYGGSGFGFAGDVPCSPTGRGGSLVCPPESTQVNILTDSPQSDIVVSSRRLPKTSTGRSSLNIRLASSIVGKYDPRQQYCGAKGGASFPGGTWNKACYTHDVCYETKGSSKLNCDIRLASDIRKQCEASDPGDPLCFAAEFIYFWAVSFGGSGPFERAQRGER